MRVPHIICRYSDYPFRGTEADLKFLRDKFADKVATLLAPVNNDHRIRMGVITLRDFVEQSYWPRCDFRAAVPAGNELHIE